MSLSDCPKCWDTPCVCGHEYKHWSVEGLRKQIEMLTKVLNEKIDKQDEEKEIEENKFYERLKKGNFII